MNILMIYVKQLLFFSVIIYLHEFEKEFYGVVISKTGKTSFVEYSISTDKSELIPGINTSLNHVRTVDYLT